LVPAKAATDSPRVAASQGLPLPVVAVLARRRGRLLSGVVVPGLVAYPRNLAVTAQ
jgi:hypothetical protein